MLVFCLRYPIRTPENELTMVEGNPVDAKLTTFTRRGTDTFVVGFTINGFHTEYSSKDPQYDEVLAAVKNGGPLKMWVSTKQETLFPRNGWVPLYGLKRGDKVILTYKDVVSFEERDGGIALSAPVSFYSCAGGLLFLLSSERCYEKSLQPVA